jgi:hypothetical protein
MALHPCRECGETMSTEARACPKCGAKVPKTKWWLWVPTGLIAAFLVFGALLPRDPAKERARDVIAECRKLERDELQPRDVRLLARNTCNSMEADFRKKYNNSTP